MRLPLSIVFVALWACSAAIHPARDGESDCQSFDSGIAGYIEGDSLALPALLGAWVLELRRDDRPAAVVSDVYLTPVRQAAGTLRLNHTWYEVGYSELRMDLAPLLTHQPSVLVIHVLQRGDSIGAMIGSTVSIVEEGDLALSGTWDGPTMRGRWVQLAVPGCPAGSFEFRRPAT